VTSQLNKTDSAQARVAATVTQLRRKLVERDHVIDVAEE
jgi:hypothetical protein